MAGYTPPESGQIVLNLHRRASSSGAEVLLVFGQDTPPAPPAVAVSPGGTRIGWQRLRSCDGACRAIPWRSLGPRDRSMRTAWRTLPAVPAAPLRVPWRQDSPLVLPELRVSWRGSRPQQLPGLRAPWASPPPNNGQELRAAWTNGRPLGHSLRIPWWASKLSTDRALRIPWGKLQARDIVIHIPWWAAKPSKDRPIRNYWGRELYERICYRNYEPPESGQIVLDLHTLLSHVGDGNHVSLFFDRLTYDLRCRQREPSGWRDNYFYQPPRPYPHAGTAEVLIVINTALLTRVLDGKPIEVFRMELSADIDSWCWSFTAKVPAASLDLVMPLDAPVAVDATINGYTWRVLIESWSESHAFARREYTIRGRSLSAWLTEPYASAHDGMSESAANARQLAEAQLEHTGWTLDWGIVDWLVPIGALSYSNATPLKVIQQIAEAAGGRVLSHRTAQQLIVLPRLHSLPWNWATATPALGINEYVVRTLSREYRPGLAFDAVFVSGENQGVLCKVYRVGTAASKLAPMVTDALITDVEPARARGKLVIGSSGKWSRESLELPLTRAGVLPGLLEIGSLISMEERGRIWRGQVVGVQVAADFGNTFTVRQNVDVERYRGQ